MDLHDNKEVFSTLEFDAWAKREGLFPEERFIIQNYLSKENATLEAGCGGGRLLLQMHDWGYRNLTGYDIVPELVEHARQRDASKDIKYETQDASQLTYPDESFPQLMYLQQVLCFIESDEKRFQAMREAYRVLARGGTIVFSLLAFEVRNRGLSYSSLIRWIRLLRLLKRDPTPIQLLPWLRHSGSFHWGAFRDARPFVYWYRAQEVEDLLKQAGFEFIGIGSHIQIAQNRLARSAQELLQENVDGAYYVVCRK